MNNIIFLISLIIALISLNLYIIIPLGKAALIHYGLNIGLAYFQFSGVLLFFIIVIVREWWNIKNDG